MAKLRFDDARNFLYANGRLLERNLFAALFEDGDPGAVVEALRGYRNPDGGFGHGLEPDKRFPASQPLDVECAFQAMDAAGRVDPDLVQGACRFLEVLGSGVGCLTGISPRYPHAPHWQEWALAPSLNPTAGIVSLLWKWDFVHNWREEATAFCWQQLEQGVPSDAHGYGEVLSFLAWVPDRERAARLSDELADRLQRLDLFRLDPDEGGYGLTPLHFAASPESPWMTLFDRSTIEAHLDGLIAEQGDDGGWPISWPTLSLAAQCEWRAIETLRALRTLRAFGRFPEQGP